MTQPKLIRITTVPVSLKTLLKGQHRFMSENGFEVVGISSSGQELQEVERDENIRTIAVEMTRTISPIKDLKSLWKLYKIFKKEKPLIIHSITPKAGLLTMLAGKMAEVPIRLHTFTGLIFPTSTGLKQKLLIAADRILCRAATSIYPEGNGVRNDLINYKITTKPLKVIGNGNVNGIDTTHFNPNQIPEQQKQDLRKSLGIQPEDFVFIFVGRIVKDKGINELISAFSSFSSLRGTKQSAKLLLVGNYERELDPLLPETEKIIDANPNIITTGYQQDVRPYFAVSDCLVFPSYREGFPNVVMQAGAMGLPSIVTDINGCNEIIINQKNGIIIPVKNVDALQQAMKKMIEDKEYYSKLKSNARSMIQSRYEQSVVWNELLEEYKSLIGNRN